MIAQIFANWPYGLQLAGLAFAGMMIGVLINWGIYSWTVILNRPISPWMRAHPKESPRRWLDYVPVIGWIGRQRDSKLYGSKFWLRPMLIELCWTLFLPWFYFWLLDGGLVHAAPDDAAVSAIAPQEAEVWLWLYGVLLALMCVGTFIDFDEQMIPDAVTVPGTLFALAVAAVFPGSRLPELTDQRGAWGIRSIDYLSPNLDEIPLTQGDYPSLLIGLGLFAIWIWALLPKLPVWDVGWGRSIRLMYAHAFRPPRKTQCKLRVRDRAMPAVTKVLCGILVAGWIAIGTGWLFLPGMHWQSLYGSLLGMAFGGGLIWSIRIIGTYSMGQEAMGFGDVTLMAMIGATLGWQAALLAFVYTIVVVVLMLTVQVIVTGNQALAFGPYLCAGATVLLFRWGVTWPEASMRVFALGAYLLYILAGSMILMGVMLIGLQWFKGSLGRDGTAAA